MTTGLPRAPGMDQKSDGRVVTTSTASMYPGSSGGKRGMSGPRRARPTAGRSAHGCPTARQCSPQRTLPPYGVHPVGLADLDSVDLVTGPPGGDQALWLVADDWAPEREAL